MKKSLLSFAAVAMLFASCSKEDTNGVMPNQGNGEKVSATFSLNVGNYFTRATEIGADGEATITTAVVYVFKSNQLEAMVSGIDASNITTTVKIEPGLKEVFAVINWPLTEA